MRFEDVVEMYKSLVEFSNDLYRNVEFNYVGNVARLETLVAQQKDAAMKFKDVLDSLKNFIRVYVSTEDLDFVDKSEIEGLGPYLAVFPDGNFQKYLKIYKLKDGRYVIKDDVGLYTLCEDEDDDVEERFEEYRSGKAKVVSGEEAISRLSKLLKEKFKEETE